MRAKRRGQNIWKWKERLHVSMPLAVKGRLLGVARENGTTLSALGYAVVKIALERPEVLDAALGHLAELEERAEGTWAGQAGIGV